MKISFIGGGKMAEAMISGILANGISKPTDIYVADPLESRRKQLSNSHGISVTTDNLDAVGHGTLIVLAIKPQTLSEVLKELKDSIGTEQTILSIVAGAPIATLASGLNHEKIVRVMPNMPAQIGAGISLWVATPTIEDSFRKAVSTIIDTLGQQLEVSDEKYLDMSTALSGSGPGYVFLFLESMIKAGVRIGMPIEMARVLSLQTILGSIMLAQSSDKEPEELRHMVTSPGGTTAAALKVLENGAFEDTLVNAIIAAYERAKILGGLS